ncbi:MAG TPA: selenocysteine-specific translation elongation factor [Burkholderiales bacterium]|nr:selenocysteine-specific translation elongation factor [Burkholderiales bacterium]
MIVATAGHIDHGKTLLVKTLTGIDTDRLPEEKARGISIDLGFAHLRQPDAPPIGFIDVPGHERFIRNMLAGVCGIDCALLVVAADDGVMPQTVEHLAILDLLEVARGICALTKIDRCPPSRVAEVTRSIEALLAPTRLAGSPVIPVSAVTGAGVDALRSQLTAAARSTAARAAAGRNFRLAIDRCFSIAGSGTVVTGTIFNGEVHAGDKLLISPAGIAARVRALQVQNRGVQSATAGNRCALNLAGADLDKADISRGDWVLAEALHRPTARIDARVKVLAAEAHALEHWTPVHLHLATADVTARVAIRRGAAIAPGQSALAQLILDEPIGALAGDRFILRDQSASRTLGGGVVIDPFAQDKRRRTAARARELDALAAPDPAAALAALLDGTADGVDAGRFEVTFNLQPQAAAELYRTLDVVLLGKERLGLRRTRVEAIRADVTARLQQFHRDQPQALGQEIERLREAACPQLHAEAFVTLVRGLADEKKVEIAGTLLRLPGHNATANTADEKLWARIVPLLGNDQPLPPSVKEVAAALKLPEKQVNDLLHRKSRAGEPIKVMDDRFLLRNTVLRLARTAAGTAGKIPGGQFTAAQFRDDCGANRKLSIQVLEYFDRIGYTQRIGDARRIRRPIEQALGAVPAQAAP